MPSHVSAGSFVHSTGEYLLLLLLLLVKIVKLLRSLFLLFISLNHVAVAYIAMLPRACPTTYISLPVASSLVEVCVVSETHSVLAHCCCSLSHECREGWFSWTHFQCFDGHVSSVYWSRQQRLASQFLLDTATCFTLFKVDPPHVEGHHCPSAPMPCVPTSQWETCWGPGLILWMSAMSKPDRKARRHLACSVG